jgi:hypothetical protein
MRDQQSDGELREHLKTELARFKELDSQKVALYTGLDTGSIQEYEIIKARWKDCAEEIKHIHRKLYPHFPRGHECPNCGCDTMPVIGTNPTLFYGCIACGDHVSIK